MAAIRIAAEISSAMSCARVVGVSRWFGTTAVRTTAAVGAESSVLTDTFQRHHTYLRVSLTERCNLRCVYCMPEDGIDLTPQARLLSRPELSTLLDLFVEQGVTKVRFTGGEPTVRPDLEAIVADTNALRAKGLRTIALTSNGIALSTGGRLRRLAESGLDAVNISLDTLKPSRFALIARREGHSKVMRSIDEAAALGLRTKVNCVVMRGVNDDEYAALAELSRERDVEVRFIEYMPFDGNKWSSGKMVPSAELLQGLERRYGKLEKVGGGAAAAGSPPMPSSPSPPPTPFEAAVVSVAAPSVASPTGSAPRALPRRPNVVDDEDRVARSYRIPGFAGRVGFISSMTDHFCGSCNRLRVTADGNLKVCLFGPHEVSLRDTLRKHYYGGGSGLASVVIGGEVKTPDAAAPAAEVGKCASPGSSSSAESSVLPPILDGRFVPLSDAARTDLVAAIGAAVRGKKARHAGMDIISQTKNRPMITIGG